MGRASRAQPWARGWVSYSAVDLVLLLALLPFVATRGSRPCGRGSRDSATGELVWMFAEPQRELRCWRGDGGARPRAANGTIRAGVGGGLGLAEVRAGVGAGRVELQGVAQVGEGPLRLVVPHQFAADEGERGGERLSAFRRVVRDQRADRLALRGGLVDVAERGEH